MGIRQRKFNYYFRLLHMSRLVFAAGHVCDERAVFYFVCGRLCVSRVRRERGAYTGERCVTAAVPVRGSTTDTYDLRATKMANYRTRMASAFAIPPIRTIRHPPDHLSDVYAQFCHLYWSVRPMRDPQYWGDLRGELTAREQRVRAIGLAGGGSHSSGGGERAAISEVEWRHFVGS